VDAAASVPAADPMIVTGAGRIDASEENVDPGPYLASTRTRKFMGLQDEMAVTAVGRAVASSGLADGISGERTGLYLAVGHIPFLGEDMEMLRLASAVDGAFSMQAFSSEGFDAVNPLLTFRCLPNMPAYHVSAAFDLQGPCFVTYPGAGQFFLALEQATLALDTGEIDVAIVLGVAHQRNALVRHHFRRLIAPMGEEGLRDEAGAIVLEAKATSRARTALDSLEIRYRPHDPFVGLDEVDEEVCSAAGPPVSFARALDGGASDIAFRLSTADGFDVSCRWSPR
jgi:3-oxoacyl-(acyl-carrier-protein) synthase